MVQVKESVIDSDKSRLFNWAELWQYKELFYFFTWRDIKIKYKQTVLGFLWAVLQPLIMMTIFTLFFGRALNVPSQNLPYPVFIFSGLILWNLFSSSLTSASNSMVNNAGIIKKIYFPRLIIPVSAVMVSLFDFVITLLIFVGLLLFYNQTVSANAIWAWPLSLIVCVMATLGPGFLLAALNVKYRDFRYVIPFLVQVLFFLTPVLYPVSFLTHPLLQYVIFCSPLYAAIELFRYPVTDVPINSLHLMASLLSAAFFLIIGIVYFRRTEDFFADVA